MTKLRTHETLVEADQPRLPVVIENQNRLNHLCQPRSFHHRLLPEGLSFRHNKDASGWCAAESGPRKHVLAPRGLTTKSPASRQALEESALGWVAGWLEGERLLRTLRLGRAVISAGVGCPLRALAKTRTRLSALSLERLLSAESRPRAKPSPSEKDGMEKQKPQKQPRSQVKTSLYRGLR